MFSKKKIGYAKKHQILHKITLTTEVICLIDKFQKQSFAVVEKSW